MDSGLYQNVHMQKICLALLGGAFFSCIFTVYIYSLNPDKQMTQADAITSVLHSSFGAVGGYIQLNHLLFLMK